MSDLYNKFPSWGEQGEYPSAGFFYEGGDQVNEKHLDALWNGVKEHIDNLNTAICNRVRDLHGNVVLDQGLVASTGSGTREVDVTASNDGAYVDGQFTGSVSSATTSHTANGGSDTRTDVVYLQKDGTIAKSEGTASAPAGTLKIAEVDVATDDTINDVRNYARDHASHIASEQKPDNSEPGDIWYDITNDEPHIYKSNEWKKIDIEELKTNGSSIVLRDTTNNQDLLVANEGGPFDLSGTAQDLRLATEQSIEDGSGNRRLTTGENTDIRSKGDTNSKINLIDGANSQTALRIREGNPVETLLPSGGLLIESEASPAENGLKLSYDSSSNSGIIHARQPGIADNPLELRSSLVDLSAKNQNLRLATGQAIEDGSGTNRIGFESQKTEILDDNGLDGVEYISGAGYYHKARASEPWIVQDRQGSFDAVKYKTSSSAPGTLALPNANLQMQNNSITTNNFEVTENGNTNSLDFNYTGS